MKNIIKNALIEALQTDEVRRVIAGIVNQALQRRLKMVDGKSDPGRQVEKEMDVNVIDVLAKYLPDVEGRMLGLQSDVSEQLARSAQAAARIAAVAEIMLEIEPVVKLSAKLFKQISERQGASNRLIDSHILRSGDKRDINAIEME